jgi:hypothetical protein
VNGNRTMAVTLQAGESRVVTSDPAPAASEALVPAPKSK